MYICGNLFIYQQKWSTQYIRHYIFFFKQKTAYEIRPCDWEFRRVLFRSPLRADARSAAMRAARAAAAARAAEIGRASCRERVYGLVYISVVAVSLKKKKDGLIGYLCWCLFWFCLLVRSSHM